MHSYQKVTSILKMHKMKCIPTSVKYKHFINHYIKTRGNINVLDVMIVNGMKKTLID